MKHAIVCRTDGTVEDMALTERHDFRWYGEQIGTDIIEVVHPHGLKRPYMFFCDEEGRLKDKPVINFLGSWLYETQTHGEPIVGDIMIMKEAMIDGECDIDGLEEGEADVLADWLLEHFWEAHNTVMKKIGHRLVMR